MLKVVPIILAAIMLNGCSLDFDIPTSRSGFEVEIKRVEQGNKATILFLEEDEEFLPPYFDYVDKIRLVGVKSPYYNSENPATSKYFALEAFNYLQEFMGETVYLEFDGVDGLDGEEPYRDQDGFILGYLYPSYETLQEKKSINQRILENGYGFYEEETLVDSWESDVRDIFSDAEKSAREAHRGLWQLSYRR